LPFSDACALGSNADSGKSAEPSMRAAAYSSASRTSISTAAPASICFLASSGSTSRTISSGIGNSGGWNKKT